MPCCFLDIAAVCRLYPLSASYHVACFRPRSLMPLLHSRPFQSFPHLFVVSGFPVFPGSWFNPSWQHFHCAMPLLHGWSPSCRWQSISSVVHSFFGSEHFCRLIFRHAVLHSRTPSWRPQPTSSWIHDIPGSVPSSSGGAPRPDCRSYAAS
jgi:hypothetical protein